MKENNLTKGVFAALLLASPMVGAEPQYPAADFEPVILYQDADYIAKHGGSAATQEDYSKTPAANFQPVVVYQDADYIAKHPTSEATAAAGQPSSYTAAPSETVTAETGGEAASESAGAAAAKAAGGAEGLLKENLPIIVVALGVLGFMFWGSRQKAAKTEEVYYDYTPPASGVPGETGVARYLKSVEPSASVAAKTGVARYLEGVTSAEPTATTGVARYLRNLD